MKKKMIIAAVFVFAFALTASSVFASWSSCCPGGMFGGTCCPKVEINANSAGYLMNSVYTKANSGHNLATAMLGPAVVNSGSATVSATIGTQVSGADINVTKPASGTVEVNANSTGTMMNVVKTKSNSGKNIAVGGFMSGATVNAGASAVGADVQTVMMGSKVIVK